MHLSLERLAYLPDVTLGRLLVGNLDLCTLEEPWIKNPKGAGGQRKNAKERIAESCIPDGEYVLKPHNGSVFKRVWRLSNHDLGVYDFPSDLPSREWGRASVLIHSGNTTDDILGCILVGLRYGRLTGKTSKRELPAVLDSLVALNLLRDLLGETDDHTLTIRPTKGTGENDGS